MRHPQRLLRLSTPEEHTVKLKETQSVLNEHTLCTNTHKGIDFACAGRCAKSADTGVCVLYTAGCSRTVHMSSHSLFGYRDGNREVYRHRVSLYNYGTTPSCFQQAEVNISCLKSRNQPRLSFSTGSQYAYVTEAIFQVRWRNKKPSG